MTDPDPTPTARVCEVCGALFVPERSYFKTCSTACSQKRVETVLKNLADHLAGKSDE